MSHEAFGPIAEPFGDRMEIGYLRSGNLAVSASVTDTSVRYPELARTKGALYAQNYIHAGDESSWNQLTHTQPEETRLTPNTFAELNWLSQEAMPDTDSYLAMEVGNTIHDAFKNLDLMPLVGLGPDDNHDEALRRLFLPEYADVRREHFPSLHALTGHQFELVRGMLETNFIRFVQSQASEDEVEKLAALPKEQRLFAIMHGIHDLAGAMSDKDETTSRSLDEPAATRLLDAAYALLVDPAEFDLPDTAHTRRLMYMQLRASRLGLDTQTAAQGINELPAKLAVADLLRCYNAEDFAVPHAAFNRLPLVLRQTWSLVQARPLEYPEKSDTRPEGLGTEYAPAFLRAFGKSEDAMYTALGCFAQISLHANALPLAMAIEQGHGAPGAAPYGATPYSKINFYHLAQTFKQEPPTFSDPVWLEYTISDNILIPKVSTDWYKGSSHTKRLVHPDMLQVREE